MKDFATHENYTCSCGSSFVFRSMRTSLYACQSCGAVHLRHKDTLVKSRKAGPTELNAGRAIGEKCFANGREFEVIGRALVETEDFKFWWYTLMPLGEQEIYILAELPVGVFLLQWSLLVCPFPPADPVELNDLISAEGKQFRVAAIFEARSVVCTGEVMWPESKVKSMWLALKYANGCNGMMIQTNAHSAVTLVDAVPEELRWERPLVVETQKHTCPKCSSAIELYGGALTFRVGCGECHHTYDLSQGDFRLLGEWANPFRPILKIGGKARLEKGDFTVLGMVVREIGTYAVNWKEYLILSEEGERHNLVEMNGHWMHCVPDDRMEFVNTDYKLKHDMYFEGEPYQLFARDYVDIAFTVGESFLRWKDYNLYVDYINPPVGLTLENHGTYRLDFRNTYLNVKTVKQQVELARPIPPTYGVGSLSAPMIPKSSNTLKVVLAVLCLLAILEVVVNKWMCENQLVSASSFPAKVMGSSTQVNLGEWGDPTALIGQLTTSSFEVDETTSLGIDLFAPVDNGYATFELVLVNEQTGEAQVYYSDVEYYYGNEDGTNWSEGSTSNEIIISSVQPGRYHMDISAESSQILIKDVRYAVRRDVIISSNNWIFLALIILSVLSLVLLHSARERKRFSNSEYNPYDK